MPTKVVLMFRTFEEIKQMKRKEFHAVKRSLGNLHTWWKYSLFYSVILVFMSAFTEIGVPFISRYEVVGGNSNVRSSLIRCCLSKLRLDVLDFLWGIYIRSAIVVLSRSAVALWHFCVANASNVFHQTYSSNIFYIASCLIFLVLECVHVMCLFAKLGKYQT